MRSTTSEVVSFKTYGGNAAENYQRYFVPTIGTAWADAVLDVARLRPGERVLDVACGTGVVTRKAAEQLGVNGRVAGLDLNPEMLAVARTAGSAGTEWIEANAELIPYPDASFDVIMCSLGLQFVENQAAALEEFHRVLADGGRVAISTVGPIPDLFETLAQGLARHIAPEAAGFMRHVFSVHDHGRLRGLLQGSGFGHVSVRSRRLRVLLPAAGGLPVAVRPRHPLGSSSREGRPDRSGGARTRRDAGVGRTRRSRPPGPRSGRRPEHRRESCWNPEASVAGR